MSHFEYHVIDIPLFIVFITVIGALNTIVFFIYYGYSFTPTTSNKCYFFFLTQNLYFVACRPALNVIVSYNLLIALILLCLIYCVASLVL